MGIADKLFNLKKEKAASNLKAGTEFLQQNKTRPAVTETASGLQYEILNRGNGNIQPAATQTVICHYHGSLIDGTVFDSSISRGTPARFPLNRVISGWTEALQLMTVGSKWKIFLPPHLAYGDRQTGTIPPNSTLIFEVELLDVEN